LVASLASSLVFGEPAVRLKKIKYAEAGFLGGRATKGTPGIQGKKDTQR
jgi:hypothetical protein